MATIKENIEAVSLDALRELKTRSDKGEELTKEEFAQLGEFYRMLYLEDGENVLLLNEKIQRKKSTRKNGDVTYTYIIKCENSKGRFDLWLTSFDACAFVLPFNKKYKNAQFSGKPKCISLDDINAVGSATTLLRDCNNQVDFICRLLDDYADENGKVRLMVKRHQVGATIDENTKLNAEVAVQYIFDAPDNTKPYTLKENGKTLFEIDLVEE